MVMGKFFKTSKLAALIDSHLYETNKYVKVHNIMRIIKRFVPIMIAFAIQRLILLPYNGVNPK